MTWGQIDVNRGETVCREIEQYQYRLAYHKVIRSQMVR